MSGPKDFTIIFAAARLAQIAANRMAEQAIRKAAAEARLAAQRRLAEQRMAEMAALRAAAQAEAKKRSLAKQAGLAEQREIAARRTAERLASVQEASRRKCATTSETHVESSPQDEMASADAPGAVPESSNQSSVSTAVSDAYSIINELTSLPDGHAQSVAASLSQSLNALAEGSGIDADLTEQVTQIRDTAKNEQFEALDRAQKVSNLIRRVVCWQEELQLDEAVVHFCRDRANVWQSDAQSMLEEHSRGHSDDAVVQRCEELLARAEQMNKEAGETQDAYATRNELLSDIVESLQEIGFFVGDPQFEDPNNPAGPVSLKATRGSEEISASIDLTDTVRSTWDGEAGEHCKQAFFQYVDQMKSRGIEVKPARADLQDRPELKQKGAARSPVQNISAGVHSCGRLGMAKKPA